MATMMIRGGDLDLVEYDFKTFQPGEYLQTLGFDLTDAVRPVDGPVTVRAPSRIHLTVLDMNRFAPEHPGGGGIGFAIQLYCTATAECTPAGIEISYSREPLLRHLVSLMVKLTGYTGGLKITAEDHTYAHIGLGSTSTILTVVAHAINTVLGSPLTDEQIRLLLGHNYVEETAEGTIAFGFETGVGPAVSTYGGFAVMGDELVLAYQHPFAEGYQVYIVIPESDTSSAGAQEFDLLMNRARSLDYQDRELKAYMVLMDLIPALEKEDVKRAGDVIWEIEFRGSKRAEVEHHSFELYYQMSRLRNAGFEFVGMSSVGPSIALITRKDRKTVEELLKPLDLSVAIETMVDNIGLQIQYP
ncbi:GHMP kinase [Methanosphaerula palustris]|uniref:GHMP kinase n=1 Tax=Methanosphaerula palustris (strain ATCC BAA-1556 / DSM 19958 / E1-9c) TaxID=521011 RepID=B8GK61_METPE|nr:GHMP kinase [Methanosphaerula palustris]ACL17132.1 GHMP kinase [Methanosphaerula palustris E1-9c]